MRNIEWEDIDSLREQNEKLRHDLQFKRQIETQLRARLHTLKIRITCILRDPEILQHRKVALQEALDNDHRLHVKWDKQDEP